MSKKNKNNSVEFNKNISLTRTENGDAAYDTTGDACLDLFSLIGGARENPTLAKVLFNRAFNQDRDKALRILFYTRDCRHGLGERSVFRALFNLLVERDPKLASGLLPFVPEYGRWDDIVSLIETPLKEDVVALVRAGLKDPKRRSLVAKWLPSCNASSKTARRLGRAFALGLTMTEKDYRKMLSTLRGNTIIENYLRQCDYSFDYAKIPAVAMHKYVKAFERNDHARYDAYVKECFSKAEEPKVDTLFPYQIMREAESDNRLIRDGAQAKWETVVKRIPTVANTIVVRDGSASMLGGSTPKPLDIATSMAIMFAERIEGYFHNRFITFSSEPKLVPLGNGDIGTKIRICNERRDCSNTDIMKVFTMIHEIQKMQLVPAKDCIRRIVIISDMEFDQGAENVPTYESLKAMYEADGMPVPQVIYLCVSARGIHFPAKPTDNILLISGFSNAIFTAIAKGENLDARTFMDETLAPYGFVSEVLSRLSA